MHITWVLQDITKTATLVYRMKLQTGALNLISRSLGRSTLSKKAALAGARGACEATKNGAVSELTRDWSRSSLSVLSPLPSLPPLPLLPSLEPLPEQLRDKTADILVLRH